MDYLSVKSTKKKKKRKAEIVDCGKSGGREESSFLFRMRLSACLQERAILKGGKAGRREEQIKATLVQKARKLQAKVLK